MVATIAFVALIMLLVDVIPPKSKTSGSMNWSNTHMLQIVTQDVRGVGRDGYGYGLQVIPMVILSSGKVVSPVVKAKQSRYGFMGRVYYEKQRQPPLLGIATGSTIVVPLDDRIRKYVFLVHALDEESDWRVFEFDVISARGQTLTIPDVLTLPLLREHANYVILREEYRRAKEEYEKAKGWHQVDLYPL